MAIFPSWKTWHHFKTGWDKSLSECPSRSEKRPEDGILLKLQTNPETQLKGELQIGI